MVLQAIRERLTGIIAVFIFAILIIPFAFVGVNSYFTSDTVNSVATVNDVNISVSDYSQGFQNYRRRMQSLMGANFDPEQFDQPIVRRQFLDSLIDKELLTQASLEVGLSVDDERLAQAIREIPAFQVDGVFNPDVYQSRLLAQGTAPQVFENDMRAQLILEQFPGTITASAIATDWELQQFVRLQDQKRSFKALMVLAETNEDEVEAELDAVGEAETAEEIVEDSLDTSLEESVEAAEAGLAEEALDETALLEEAAAGLSPVDEEEIVAWYEAHPDQYRSEEQVSIEYIELNAANMEDDVAPDEDQLRARFAEQEARFITPESRLASHILIEVSPEADEATIETARQMAEGLAQRARDGDDFAALATEYSQDAGSAADGGDLGWIEPGFMVKAFEDGLYALSLEAPISNPVQTGFGWHVIQLRDVRPAEGMSFEEARDILVEEYNAENQERKFLEQADRLVDLIYEDPTTLNAAAEELDLEVQEAGPFGRSGGDGIAANADVVNAAFSDLVLAQGAVSDPVDLGENHIVMLRIKEHFPEALKPLSEVRDEVIASVERDKAMKAAAERAEGLLAQLEAGVDILTLAEDEAVELIEMDETLRTTPAVPADLRAQVFLMPAPEGDSPRLGVVALDNGYAVVQLTAVVDGEVSEDDLIRQENYRRRIANSTANSEALGFLRMLREQSEVEVYEDRL